MAETPPIDRAEIERDLRAHYKTPKRAKVLGTIEYLQKRYGHANKTDVFRAFDVPVHIGWRMPCTAGA